MAPATANRMYESGDGLTSELHGYDRNSFYTGLMAARTCSQMAGNSSSKPARRGSKRASREGMNDGEGGLYKACGPIIFSGVAYQTSITIRVLEHSCRF
jgi:hypothetical protein